MTNKEARKTAERTETTADGIESIANQLTFFRDAYAKVAEEMRAQEIESIRLKGVANLMYWMDRMNGAMQSLQSALMDARLESLRSAAGKPGKLSSESQAKVEEATAKSKAVAKEMRSHARKKKASE